MGSGNGEIHYRDTIAIVQLVLFSVSFFAGWYFRWTHRICWYTLGGFSVIRCVGAGCMLGTVNRDSSGLWAGAFVCESLGVLLLVFTLFEMLTKIDKSTHVVHERIFWILQLLTWIDVGTSIGGMIAVTKKKHDKLLPTAWSRASIAILILIYFYTLGVWVYFWIQRRRYDSEHYMLTMCAGIALPFLLARVLYSAIFVITTDIMWNAVKGSPTAYLLMTMLPEAAFVAVCCFAVQKTTPGIVEKRNGKYQLQGNGQTWPEMRR